MEKQITTRSRQWKRDWKRKDIIRVATWNIKSIRNRHQKIMKELKERNIDICALQETKKKGKGQIDYGEYILAYSGVDSDQNAFAGVGILIQSKYRHSIVECVYHSERILILKFSLGKKTINIISIYSPENCKPKREREQFFENLQNTLDKIPSDELVIVMGDFNARIGNTVIPGVKQRFHEDQINDNGELMVNLCSFNNLRINNTFYNHKDIYKYTFFNSRKQTSMVDYIVTNRNILPSQILDVRTLNSANVGTDHKLLLGKIRMRLRRNSEQCRVVNQEKFNVEELCNEPTKILYQQKLAAKIDESPITWEDDVDNIWHELQTKIKDAARETLGTRRIKLKHQPCKTPWFRKEMKEKFKQRRKAYLDYRSQKTEESLQRYKKIRNETKDVVRRAKSEYWISFSRGLDTDFYGIQKQIWRLLRQQKKEVNELVEAKHIEESKWIKYLTELYQNDNLEDNQPINITISDDITITSEDVRETLSKLKNHKSPGHNQIPNELLKYGGEILISQITSLSNKILLGQKVPTAWKTSSIIPMFKRGDKKEPKNYTGIYLLDSMLKLITKIFTTKINSITTLADQQQGFRTGRSCTDAIFVMRQVLEKSIEFNKPAFLCFIDLQNAFEKIQLKDVIRLLYSRGIPKNLVETIKDIYSQNNIQLHVNGKLTQKIPIYEGIRQGDSLGPLLLNIVMDEIITEVETCRGYKLGDKKLNILCYGGNAVLFAEKENDLQRNLEILYNASSALHMTIDAKTIKCMTTSKERLQCKLEVNQTSIEQVFSFRYLGVELTSSGGIDNDITEQIMRANKIAGSLNDLIWTNNHLNVSTKSRIYKTTLRPILTYMAETKSDSDKTTRILDKTEMKILRRITGNALDSGGSSQYIRGQCRVENIGDWILKRKSDWDAHIERMDEGRIVKVARDKIPVGKRSPGRPKKRWSDGLRS
ncbi:hypothetical protein WA026_014379 [Henosepilachna vigintioctopunctata]|uniref:Reverse transcriptase domain-containing protein n=1 Tax=Henosepilachna vigintioctopunctata TaxID=420089 RepID=A0AAW1UBM9_9CUCU